MLAITRRQRTKHTLTPMAVSEAPDELSLSWSESTVISFCG